MIMRYTLKESEKIRNRSQQENDREYDYDNTNNLIDNPDAAAEYSQLKEKILKDISM